jgi:uncharacterized protein YggE
MVRGVIWLTVLGFGMTTLSASSRAETPKEGTITASGSETVRVRPTLLRLQAQIHGSGPTVEKAVEDLKTRRKSAAARLKELNAEADSIRFGSTVIANSANYQPGATIYTPNPYGPAVSPMNAPLLPPGIDPGEATPPMSVPAAPWPGGVPTPAPRAPILSPPADSSSDAAPPAAAPIAVTAYYAPPEVPPPADYAAPVPAPAVAPPVAAPAAGPFFALPADSAPTLSPPSYGVATAPSRGYSGVPDASASLVAEWRLDTDDPDAIALTAESLRGKLERARAFWPVYNVSFVARLSDAQRKSATAAAAAKARRRADELVEAAGVRLGNGYTISSEILFVGPESTATWGAVGAVYTGITPQDPSEFVNPSPVTQLLTVRVSIAYSTSPLPSPK